MTKTIIFLGLILVTGFAQAADNRSTSEKTYEILNVLGDKLLDKPNTTCLYVPEMKTQNVQAGNDFELKLSSLDEETIICFDDKGAIVLPTNNYYKKTGNHYIKTVDDSSYSTIETYSIDLKNNKLYYVRSVVFNDVPEVEKIKFLAGTVSAQGDIIDTYISR